MPGSLNIELNSGFASYIGWLLPYDAPLALLLPESEDVALAEAMTQLIRIGWSRIEGYLPGGFARWRAHGGDIAAYENASVDDLCQAQRRGDQPLVLDVRQELEWGWGTIPGSVKIFIADLPARIDELPSSEPIWVICSNGHRASIAASLLARSGRVARLIGTGGVGEWRANCRDQR